MCYDIILVVYTKRNMLKSTYEKEDHIMDMFIEKIVRRHKSVVDVLLIFLIIIGAIGLSFLALIYNRVYPPFWRSGFFIWRISLYQAEY